MNAAAVRITKHSVALKSNIFTTFFNCLSLSRLYHVKVVQAFGAEIVESEAKHLSSQSVFTIIIIVIINLSCC